jgi:hypothetical protein
MYVVEKKITGWIVLQYKIIITKYQNTVEFIYSEVQGTLDLSSL